MAKSVQANDLSVGELAARAGVAVSTLHYYESKGLISSWRNSANHRRYDRRELRRVAIVRVAQSVGMSLKDIRETLDRVPKNRAVGKADWEAAAKGWHDLLDRKIELMMRLRDQMGFCIGCGCLSLENCPLYNRDDELGKTGSGPRRWLDQNEES